MRHLPNITAKNLFEAFITVGGRIASIVLIVGTTKFLTNFLSEKDYGQLALYNSIATLPSLFFYGPLGQGITRYLPVASENNELRQFDKQYKHLFRTGSFFILAIGSLAGFACWVTGMKHWGIASALIVLLNIFNGINSYRYGLQNSARKRILSLTLETGSRILQQVLAIVLLLLVSDDPLIALCGYCLGSFIFYFVIRYYYYQTFPEIALESTGSSARINGKYSSEILTYSWPFFLFGAVTWFQTASDRWALELICNTETVARFAVLNQIGFQSLVLLFGSFSFFLYPIMLNRAGHIQTPDRFRTADTLNNWYLGFNALMCGVLFCLAYVFGPFIIRLLSAEKYVSEAHLLPYMVLAGCLFNFGQSYTNKFALSMQTRLLVYPKIGTAIIGIVLNFILVKHYNLQGLTAALVMTQAIYIGLLIGAWEIKGRYAITRPPQ